jgi:tyrosine-protein kinase Etk/Wzc
MARLQAPVAADVEVDVRAVLKSLLRALPYLIVFAVLVGGGTLYFLSRIPPVYQSEATVLIEAGESDLTRSDSTAATGTILDKEAIASQVQLIRSGDLARVVASKLDLESQPQYRKAVAGSSFLDDVLARFGLAKPPSSSSIEERVLAEYYRNLEVSTVTDSRVIAIDFSSTDPQLAARGANTIAAEYITLQRAAMRDTTEEATRWLESQISDLREKVAEAEAKVEKFRTANDLFASGGETTTLSQQQLSDLNAELARVRAARADAETKATQIRASLKTGAEPNITDVPNSQLIQRLVEQEVALRAQIAQLSATLLPGHPRMRELNAQLADLDSQITAEAQKIVASLEAEADLSRAREDDIQHRLDALKATVVADGGAEVQLRALERDATDQRELLDSYLLRYRDAVGRQNGDYLPANARIISSATVPISPDFPKLVPMTAAATVAALLLMIAIVLIAKLASGRPTGRVAFGEPLPIVPDAVPVVGHMRWADDHGVRRMMPSEPTLVPSMAGEFERSLSRISSEIVSGGKRRVIVTLAEGADASGRPLAAAALARALARGDRRAVLIDFRNDGANGASMGEGSGLPGFTDLFAGEASFAQVIFRDRRSRAHFIPAGRLSLTPARLAGERMATILGALDHTYDHLIFDASDDLLGVVGPTADAAMVVSEFAAADPRTVRAFDRIAAVSPATILLLIVDPVARRERAAVAGEAA